MPSLQVRELPDVVYGRLKQAAQAEHRSIAQQAIVLLSKGLGLDEDPVQRRQKLVTEIKSHPLPQKKKKLTEPAQLIRQDRNR